MLVDGALLGEGPGQHELGFEYRAGRFDYSIKRGRHPLVDRMLDPLLRVRPGEAGAAFVPAPVKVLRDGPELDDQITREILRFALAALLLPQSDQIGFIVA